MTGSPQNSSTPQNSYTVVARRYRPQAFADLVGQAHIVTALSNAIQQSRVGHAYLFTGARGVGKTSSARIFAKCLNCVQGPTIRPCNECDVCGSVSVGEDIDVLEIDGASNRGIDEIRQLRSNANIRPSRCRFKIYIIDEVHMLTKEAFNALLKTLEEPPEHVKFIFCTTDPHKIPITVLSRCQRFDFVPVNAVDITQRLREIATAEQVEADDEALELLARRANGSMRDSQSLLEQLLSFCGNKITVDDVHSLLGTADMSRIFSLCEAMLGRNPAAAMQEIHGAISEGVDAGQLASQLVGFFRDLMVVKVGGDQHLLLNVSGGDFPRLAGIASNVGTDTLLSSLQIVDQAVVRMQSSMHSRVLLEAAILRISELENFQSIADLLANAGGVPAVRNQSVEATAGPTVIVPAKAIAQVAPTAPVVAVPKVELTEESKKKEPVIEMASQVAEPVLATNQTGNAPANHTTPADVRSAEQIWKAALAGLGDMTADVAGDYQRVEMTGQNAMKVTFGGDYQVQLCNRPDRRQRLETSLADVAGRIIRIDFVAASTWNRIAGPAQPRLSRRQQIKQLELNPLVQTTIETFDAEVVDFELPREPARNLASTPSDAN